MMYAIHKTSKEHRIIDEHSRCPAELWRYMDAGPGGWIPWEGGECPLPEGALHEVKSANGAVLKSDEPEDDYWGMRHGTARIIAYRPILDAEPSIDVTRIATRDEPPAWDGEGPARIGDRVACISSASDEEFEIIHWHAGVAWLRGVDSGRHALYPLDELRPIRSEEDQAVEEMQRAYMQGEDEAGHQGGLRALYRAGYRKQEDT